MMYHDTSANTNDIIYLGYILILLIRSNAAGGIYQNLPNCDSFAHKKMFIFMIYKEHELCERIYFTQGHPVYYQICHKF